MKYVVAGDIHGSIYHAKQLCEKIREYQPEKIILLGDIYGGGSLKEIDRLFNGLNIEIESIEGNCDHRYVNSSGIKILGSNILEHYLGRKFFYTHGHIYNRYRLPSFLKKGDVFIYGHTHICGINKESGIHIVNAGSVSEPRGLSKNSFILIDGNIIEIRDVEFGDILYSLEL